MTRVFKYQIPLEDRVVLDLPSGAKVLCVQVQRDKFCIWAVIDPEAIPERRVFRWAGTGHFIDYDPRGYVGTVQVDGGALVFHLFETPE